MILHDCQVLTMDPRMPRASALAIAGGRILGGVDSREDAIASQAHERVGLGGATVVPGFCDSHVHLAAWATRARRLDLGGVARFEDLQQALAGAAAQATGSTWIVGDGLRIREVLGDPPLPDLGRALDDAAQDRPALLIDRDGHGVLATSAALAASGLDIDALAGLGPVWRRDDGSFNGLAREHAAWALRAAVPDSEPTTAELARALREAARRGVTAIHDMDGPGAMTRWRRLEAERGLPIRIWQHIHPEQLEAAATLGVDAGFGSDRLRIAGVKAFADGTLGSGTAWLDPPGADGSGEALLDAEAIADLTSRAHAAGLPVTIHAIGDGAVAAAAHGIARGRTEAPRHAGWDRIEHAQLVPAGAIGSCLQAQVAVGIQPTHLASDLAAAEAAWADRLDRAYPWRMLHEAGLPLLIGSDAPIEDLDPLAALRTACAPPVAGRDGWPGISLPAEAALAAMTTLPAHAVGAGAELGMLSKGYRADLVVLSGNPLEDPDVEVVATMVGGRFVHGRNALGQA